MCTQIKINPNNQLYSNFEPGDHVASGLTLALVLAPGFFVFLSELKRCCCGKSNIFKAIAYLLLSPLWAIVIHLYR